MKLEFPLNLINQIERLKGYEIIAYSLLRYRDSKSCNGEFEGNYDILLKKDEYKTINLTIKTKYGQMVNKRSSSSERKFFKVENLTFTMEKKDIFNSINPQFKITLRKIRCSKCGKLIDPSKGYIDLGESKNVRGSTWRYDYSVHNNMCMDCWGKTLEDINKSLETREEEYETRIKQIALRKL